MIADAVIATAQLTQTMAEEGVEGLKAQNKPVRIKTGVSLGNGRMFQVGRSSRFLLLESP